MPIAATVTWALLVQSAWTPQSVLYAFGLACASLVIGLLVLCVLALLTFIEEMGIQTYGRLHKRRITNAVAETVCAHACIGWMTGAALFWVPIIVHVRFNRLDLAFLAPIGLFLGLLHFEILVWMGVRRCRYANRERPDQNPAT